MYAWYTLGTHKRDMHTDCHGSSVLLKIKPGRDFPGGPVAKTLSSQWRGPKFNPWSGSKISHAATKTWCSQINKY